MAGHGLGHVGLYIGRGRMIHAPQSGERVEIQSLASRSGSIDRRIVIARFRRAARDETRQLRWFGYAVTVVGGMGSLAGAFSAEAASASCRPSGARHSDSALRR